MQASELELVPDVSVSELGRGERLALSAIRFIGMGSAGCGRLADLLRGTLGERYGEAREAIILFASMLPVESPRRLTLCKPCQQGVTWDEAAILALVEACQRSDATAVDRWFFNLGVTTPSSGLRHAAQWVATSFAARACGFLPETARLTFAGPGGRSGARVRD